MFLLLVDGGNAREYFGRIAQGVGKFSKILVVVLPCLVVLKIVIKRLYAKENTKHNRDTLPLKIFKSAAKVTMFLRDACLDDVTWAEAADAVRRRFSDSG